MEKHTSRNAKDYAFARLGEVLYEIASSLAGDGCPEKSQEGDDVKCEKHIQYSGVSDIKRNNK